MASHFDNSEPLTNHCKRICDVFEHMTGKNKVLRLIREWQARAIITREAKVYASRSRQYGLGVLDVASVPDIKPIPTHEPSVKA